MSFNSYVQDPVTVQVPGPAGAAGGDGADGADGDDAFSDTTAQFVAPNANGDVTIHVGQSNFCAAGLPVFIESAGCYTAQSVPSATTIVVRNLGYPDNSAAGTVIPAGSKVVPCGFRGPAGA